MGHRTEGSASGTSVCLCPYVYVFRALDHNMNPKDFCNDTNSRPVQLQTCLICVARPI